MSVVIAGTGSYLPERVVTNAEIEALAADFDRARAGARLEEWARRKHGGVVRHHVAPGEATSDLATQAARRALDDAGLAAGDLELIVMATITGDYRLPQAAGMVQANLGSHAKFVQLDSACSGFVDAVLVAHALLEVHRQSTALVVCADTLTCLNDPAKFLPMTVFGDGAGAVVLRRDEALDGYGIAAFATGSDGEIGDYVVVPGGGSKRPLSQEVLDQGLQYWRFDFPHISAWAVERMARATREAVAGAGIGLEDVRWVVPHQASVRIVHDVARRLGLPEEMFILTYAETGNTSAASIPIALDEARRRGAFADGDWLVMPAVGAGMAWGAFTYCWWGGTSAGAGFGRACRSRSTWLHIGILSNMSERMRTSVDIPDPLLRRAKRRARERGTTLREVVLDGLRTVTGSGAARHEPYEPADCTFGGDGLVEGLSWSDTAGIRDLVYEGRGG